MNKDFLYKDISYQIRGTCFWVWKEFGNAFKESIVDNALTEELKKRGLKVETQKKINIFYEGKKVGVYVPDKIINDCILLETKCKPFLTNSDIKQFWHYLKGTKYKVGFLINFGGKGLETKRVVYDVARSKDQRLDLRKRSASKSAFTLVEMLVVVGIFSLIVGAISGLFISGVSAQKRILSTQELLDQTSYALEYMGRALRMARKELAAPTCLSQNGLNYELVGSDLRFKNSKGICQRFFLEGGQLKEQNGWLLVAGIPSGGTTLPLTSNLLQINSLKFNLSGQSQTDNLQPRVTIFLEILGRGQKNQPKIQIQTSISQRNLDVQY